MLKKGIRKVCNRGHVFWKSSDCPVCPKCWPGRYAKKFAGTDLPKTSAPAQRALDSINIRSLVALSKKTEREIAELHGMGPKALGILKKAMQKNRLQFRVGK